MQLLLLTLAIVVALIVVSLVIAALKFLLFVGLILLVLAVANYYRGQRRTPIR
jgi:hypothetical protein